jgi:Uma2 family endonuclease
MTIEEFAEIDEPERFDLIRGELVCMPPASVRHGIVGSRIATALGVFALQRDLGEAPISSTGYILRADLPVVLCPDASFVRVERLPIDDLPEGFFEQHPDIAVEVVSSSDRMADVSAKVDEYLLAGTPLVWVVEPHGRAVTVYRPDGPIQVLREAMRSTAATCCRGSASKSPRSFGSRPEAEG